MKFVLITGFSHYQHLIIDRADVTCDDPVPWILCRVFIYPLHCWRSASWWEATGWLTCWAYWVGTCTTSSKLFTPQPAALRWQRHLYGCALSSTRV